jgi:hypothetical protein
VSLRSTEVVTDSSTSQEIAGRLKTAGLQAANRPQSNDRPLTATIFVRPPDVHAAPWHHSDGDLRQSLVSPSVRLGVRPRALRASLSASASSQSSSRNAFGLKRRDKSGRRTGGSDATSSVTSLADRRLDSLSADHLPVRRDARLSGRLIAVQRVIWQVVTADI